MENDLNPAARQEPVSSSHLLPLVYEELRRLARGQMAGESGLQTISATVLVHEAWLRVSRDQGQRWESRRHFLGAAAQAMRCVLINRARDKKRLKRGGEDAERVELDALSEAEAVLMFDAPDEELLAVDEALDRLTAEDAVSGEIVRLRYFAGLTWPEISELMGMSERDLGRQWAFARAWLRDAMEG
ncbi:MAG: sigma-70 family RNA polymerase sigma factor [Verrucomicrobiaceae bacterium]|nr:sigma-70 family RNA polymerase sigma factor [Verrucomicrobiaceae bacterium]